MDVVEVRWLRDFRLWLRFEDGAVGELDVAGYVPFEGVFAPLVDEAFFRRVSVHPESGAIVWPNGADLDPDVLHATVTGRSIERLETTPAP